MNKIDKKYQAAVDKEAEKYLNSQVSEIVNMTDDGNFVTEINGKKTKGVWYHYRFSNDLHHLFFLLERPYLVILRRKYLNGIKLVKGKIDLLTEEEISQYD